MIRKAIPIVLPLAVMLVFCLPPAAESGEKKGISETTKQGYQSIPKDEFRRVFEEYVCLRLGKQKSDVIVSELKVTSDKRVPAGKVSFQIFEKEKRRLLENVGLMAVIRVDGVVRNRVKLSGWVDAFDSVVCSSHNLKRGAIINKDDIYLVRKNISHLSPDVLTDTVDAIGLMVKHTVKGDSCLAKWMLERPPIVNKGDTVTILAESVDLEVTVPGRILEKGYLGDVVGVQNSMSEKKIYARVMSNSTVKVDF